LAHGGVTGNGINHLFLRAAVLSHGLAGNNVAEWVS
jgi:hypothetical protein